MSRRLITGIIGLPIIVYIIIRSGVLLKTTLLIIALMGLYEFYNALKIKNKIVSCGGYGAAVLYMYLLDRLTANGIIFTVSIFTLIALSSLVIMHGKITVYDAAVTVFGFFYICFLLSNIYLVREHWLGKYAVWLIVISAWGCDTGAYFTGLAFGRHKLAPSLSPKKTVEGAVGGVAAATLIGLCYGLILQNNMENVETELIFLSTIIVFFSSVFSQLGDLAASSIKRQTDIKDFSNVIPGHGGILDRIDSILFTAPSVYCVLIVFDVIRRTL